MSDFAIGQRWLSENETELGLGLVQAVDHRLVTIFFPASEDQRTYAKDNAPLARVTYQCGEQIETLDGQLLKVKSIEPLNDILIYMAKAQDSNDIIPVPETQLNHHLELNKASDRLFSGQIDSSSWFELRYAAMQVKKEQEHSQINGLQGPRVDLIGHQLYIANQVGSRYAPRVLLADEVGLGKTIEAGMIIHQQLLNHRSQRVLICVPQSLVNQWFVEMIRRFNLHFSIFDQDRIDALTSIDEIELSNTLINQDLTSDNVIDTDSIDSSSIEIENPFLSEQLVLCSHEFLVECQVKQLIEGEWDLLVVDEAHHLEWSKEKPSESYNRVETIAEKIPGLLLLSATPEQLGQESHFARLRLLDPDRFHSLEAFIAEQDAYQPIAELVSQMIDSENWDNNLINQISEYIQDIEINPSNKETIIKELLDRNGTGRILYRNTRQNITGFPQRKVFPHPLEANENYANEISDHIEEMVSSLLHPETQYEDDSWLKIDPRVEWLSQFLKENRKERVLIICSHKNTAMALEAHCRFKLGFNCGSFHEDMDLISRDRAAAHFADPDDGAQALFCSEIGSEGRNFQFSHQLVLLDLPANPDLLEQRIGRLDRIGQNQDIQIHVPFIQKSAQEIIFNWYHIGMNAFQKTNASGSAIFKQTKAQLFDTLINYNDLSQQKSLIKKTQETAEKINHMVESGKDKLLALASYDDKNAQELIQQVTQRDEKTPHAFMSHCWDKFGIQVEDHSEDTYIVSPGDHMFLGYFPKLPEDGITATYSREKALSRDDIAFLTWEHPMVKGAVDLVLSEDKGNACVCILKNRAIKAGTILLEAIYHIKCAAPQYIQVQRFLPYQTIRTLVDSRGNNLADKVSHENLSKQCDKIPKNTARQVLKSESKVLRSMLAKSDDIIHTQANQILSSIVDKMKAAQTEEFNRLVSLQKKNPNIRQSEIDFVNLQTKLLEKYLADAQVELAAIRTIIAV